MHKSLLIPLLLLIILLISSCSASDPIKDDLYSEASYIRLAADGGGGYWHEYNEAAVNISPGLSEATFIAPNASSLGGWRLDAIANGFTLVHPLREITTVPAIYSYRYFLK